MDRHKFSLPAGIHDHNSESTGKTIFSCFKFTYSNSKKHQVHTVRVVDVSAQRKTAQHLKILMISVIEEVQLGWKVNIVAVTSDASGESRAAWKRLVEEFPSLVSADCYAHQVIMSIVSFVTARY